jgi:O-acetyl-ADP-ribose deacetylase (regulator of RNase III)
MKLYLRDRNEELCNQWSNFFKDCHDVTTQVGDFFKGPLPEAIVSPANSFGYMDGGIDMVYIKEFGWELQNTVQAEIAKLPFKELLIGQAITVPTGNEDIPWMISAPTMRMPGPTTTWAVYLAMRAAMDQAVKRGFKSVACPGLGTLTGRIPPVPAAEAMYNGYVAGYQMQLEETV